MSSQTQLVESVLALSEASEWNYARSEWELKEVFEKESQCLCGHEIFNNCLIRNRFNKQFAVVGNCCVKKFVGLPSDPIFRSIKRVRSDKTQRLGVQALDHGVRAGWIGESERTFYVGSRLKRKLTAWDKDLMQRINEYFLTCFKLGGRPSLSTLTPLELVNELAKMAEIKARLRWGSSEAWDLAQEALRIIHEFPELKADFEEFFLSIDHANVKESEFVQICMSKLQWPQVKEEFGQRRCESIARDGAFNGTDTTYSGYLRAFEDGWTPRGRAL